MCYLVSKYLRIVWFLIGNDCQFNPIVIEHTLYHFSILSFMKMCLVTQHMAYSPRDKCSFCTWKEFILCSFWGKVFHKWQLGNFCWCCCSDIDILTTIFFNLVVLAIPWERDCESSTMVVDLPVSLPPFSDIFYFIYVEVIYLYIFIIVMSSWWIGVFLHDEKGLSALISCSALFCPMVV